MLNSGHDKSKNFHVIILTVFVDEENCSYLIHKRKLSIGFTWQGFHRRGATGVTNANGNFFFFFF